MTPAEPLTLGGLLSAAGWTMYPLYACSLAALAMTMQKVAEFAAARVDDLSLLEHVGEAPTALQTRLQGRKTPLARVLNTTLQALTTNPTRTEAIVERAANAELDRLSRGLTLLAFIAQVAPLFGLLGTVLGMVDLFSGLEAAGRSVDSSTLSSGIWKALLTTAAGLTIAIPTMGAHTWLSARLNRLQLAMEQGTGGLIDRVDTP